MGGLSYGASLRRLVGLVAVHRLRIGLVTFAFIVWNARHSSVRAGIGADAALGHRVALRSCWTHVAGHPGHIARVILDTQAH